jgi:hypothetical protein
MVQAQWRFEMDDSDGWRVINRYSGQKLAHTIDGDSAYRPVAVDMSFDHANKDNAFDRATWPFSIKKSMPR